MNIFLRILNRIRFRKEIQSDQSINVIDSMAKAHILYRELSIKAHPDRNPNNREIAEELMQKVVDSKCNYANLVALSKEIKEKLGK